MFVYQKDGSWKWRETTLIPYSIAQYLKVSKLHEIGGSVTSPGTKVLYMPTHVYPDPMGVDVEAGFIVRTQLDTAFCMFFSRSASHAPHFLPDVGNLRTRANTEPTSMNDIYFANYPGHIYSIVAKLEREKNNVK